jgi:hypothetical protein
MPICPGTVWEKSESDGVESKIITSARKVPLKLQGNQLYE